MKRVNLFLINLAMMVALSVGISSCGGGNSSSGFGVGEWEGTKRDYYDVTRAYWVKLNGNGTCYIEEKITSPNGNNTIQYNGHWSRKSDMWNRQQYNWIAIEATYGTLGQYFYVTADGSSYSPRFRSIAEAISAGNPDFQFRRVK